MLLTSGMRPSTNVFKPEKNSMGSQKRFCSAMKYRKQHISPSNPDEDKDSQPGDFAKNRRNLEMGSLNGYEQLVVDEVLQSLYPESII
jgi:hypothetical protein